VRVLLVDPQYRRERPGKALRESGRSRPQRDDETLWYPPVGLMKLSQFHRMRGDEVRFAIGCDPAVCYRGDLFSPGQLWDRVYITTVFTFHFAQIVKTIKFYLEAVGGTVSKVYVGGPMASIMPEEVFEETGVYPVCGIVHSARQLGFDVDTNIDLLPPDYNLVDGAQYAVNDTYYAFSTKGCTRSCPWCAVPKIEPDFSSYIDIKPIIRQLRLAHGDKSTLKLMDNNILASPELERIVADLLQLGYGKGEYTRNVHRKQRVVDFNQGIDARYINESTMPLLAQLNVRPMRIAFDRLAMKSAYVNALELGRRFGVRKFSNYMLYNYHDSPRDLYERLIVNIEMNEKWLHEDSGTATSKIYSYPMRFAPIDSNHGDLANRKRDQLPLHPASQRDWLEDPVWTPRFVRNLEIMRGAVHGAIPPSPGFARRAIGETFQEFVTNLYMPEQLLRNRNKHERRIYAHEPKRAPGTGLIEDFREFVLALLTKKDGQFETFHNAVSVNSVDEVRKCLQKVDDPELEPWLKLYLTR
jgi:hypothetical protein